MLKNMVGQETFNIEIRVTGKKTRFYTVSFATVQNIITLHFVGRYTSYIRLDDIRWQQPFILSSLVNTEIMPDDD